MSSSTRRFVDLTPLRTSPAFARLWLGTALAGIGATLTVTAVGLQLFELTGSTLAVGLVGGIALVPMILAGPWGGMLADSFDRRTVMFIAQSLAWVSTLGLIGLSLLTAHQQSLGQPVIVWPFYVFTTLSAVSYIVVASSRTATYARLLPADQIASASALSGISVGTQLTVGPALAAALVAGPGFAVTYLVDAVLASLAFVGILGLPKQPPLHESVERGWQSLRSGFKFLAGAVNVRTSFIADIIAMSLGRPYALLPAVATFVVGGGPVTVGVLTVAMALGTLATSVFSGPVGSVRRYGVAITGAIAVYGTLVFSFGVLIILGLMGVFGPHGTTFDQVNWFALSISTVIFFGLGVSDEISAIFRSTLLLTAVPDEMRGRLQGVFFTVVAGGPRLGDLYVGLLASAIALWAPPLFGGIVIVVLMMVLLRVVPSFRNYDSAHPQP